MPAAISVMVCILKGLSRFTQGNQMQYIRSETGGSSDVQKLSVKTVQLLVRKQHEVRVLIGSICMP